MDARRRHYLHLLDIDCYQQRTAAPEEPAAAAIASPPLTTAGPQPASAIKTAATGASTTALTALSVAPVQASDLRGLSLDALALKVEGCQACGLHRGRQRTVFGSGAAGVAWMIIGEAPGAEEDIQGLPFVGRAGQLLTAMLEAMDLTREQVYIANTVKCRPPQNRDPSTEETQACRAYLDAQVTLVAPKLIVALGRVAAQSLLNSSAPLGQLRRQVHRYPGRDIPLVVTYHPAYLLRAPKEKRKAWEDLLFARDHTPEPGLPRPRW